MAFSIDSYIELLALNRALMEAKFSNDPNDNDIAASPIVASIVRRLIDELTIMHERADVKTLPSLDWKAWCKEGPGEREMSIIRRNLTKISFWNDLDNEQRSDYIENLIAPFVVDNDSFSELLEYADKHNKK